MRAQSQPDDDLSYLLISILRAVKLEVVPILDVHKDKGELRGRCPFHFVARHNTTPRS